MITRDRLKYRYRQRCMVFVLSIWSVTSSCSGNNHECQNNTDCQGDEICLENRCKNNPFGRNTAIDTDKVIDTYTYWDTDTETNIQTQTDTVDTATEPECTSKPSVENGHACGNSCDCFSGHCNNGFCCKEGECCNNAADCSGDLCATAQCIFSECEYHAGAFDCGVEDQSGEQCNKGFVCDGERNCIPVATDCGWWRARSDYDCSGPKAVVDCYDFCSVDNQSTNCVDGANCFNGVCRPENAKVNGSECKDGDECISGHCNNGYCCTGGDCCVSNTDCSDECRLGASCDTANFQCIYLPDLACGKEDTGGTGTCTGTSRCDGAGACLPVTSCDDQNTLFASDGTYSCGAGSVSENCRNRCSSNAHCGPGALCDLSDNTCKLDNGQPCGSGSQCYAGYCNNGYCCNEGNCCNDNTDCNLSCASGGVCNTSLHNCEGPSVFEECGVQTAECSGDSRCDGAGNCVVAKSFCSDNSSTGEYKCDGSAVVEACSCSTDKDCDDDGEFCTGVFKCGFDKRCRFDSPVDVCVSTACFDNVTCNEVTDRCEGGDDPCADLSNECDDKICLPDGVEGYSCEDNFLADGTPCDDGDLCSSASDICTGGSCIPGPVNTAPCFDGNPCTVDKCTANEGYTVTCSYSKVSPGDSCQPEFACYDADATCEWNQAGTDMVCIQRTEVCDNGYGVCYINSCKEDITDFGNSVLCSSRVNSSYRAIGCGETVVLTAGNFASRDYESYGGGCVDTDDYIGKEAFINLKKDSDPFVDIAGANFVIEATKPIGYSLSVMQMVNRCDPDNCVKSAVGGLDDIDILQSESPPTIILDSISEVWPPESVTIRLDCP